MATNEFLTARQIEDRFGVSRAWIDRRMRDAAFPAPVRFGGRRRYWRVADVIAWERRMIGGEEPKTPRHAT